MNLASAFRLNPVTRLALVGAGGKSTALFTLGRQIGSQALLTTTTHLSIKQIQLADHSVPVTDKTNFADLANRLPQGSILFSGPDNRKGQITSLSPAALEQVLAIANQRRIPLLIEADGSRCLPVKAPAAHEPPIPDFVDTVVVVVGLSAIGCPLDEKHVFRHEIFSVLSEIPLNQPITIEGLRKVLCNPLGGLKNIPPNARRLILLTQISTTELREQAEMLAGRLLDTYDSVTLSQLSGDRSQPELEPSVISVHERIAAIILAAGAASRFGRPKVIMDWNGEPMIRQVAQTALKAGLNPVVIITGAHPSEVQKAVAGLPVELMDNPDWSSGQSTSIQTGLRSLPDRLGGAAFFLADQPQIPVSLVTALIKRHSEHFAAITAPKVNDRRGNPVLFDRVTFPKLMELSGDTGGRKLFDRYPVDYLDWDDQDILLDIDTPEDYERLFNKYKSKPHT